jgi:hypothetical protein
MYVKHLRRRLKRAFSLQELRMDLAHTINDDEDIPDNHEWKRAADFLPKTGNHDWGHDLRCIRLDRFDLEDIHAGFESACDWERTKVLVLNSLLRWHYRLFPDRDESKSVRRIRDADSRSTKHDCRICHPPKIACDNWI